MRKAVVFSVTCIVLAVVLAGCGTPPPLISDKYLNDASLINSDTNVNFHSIVPGTTTYTDAVAKAKADAMFTNVQTQDKPPAASWAAKDSGEVCCQLSANDQGVVNSMIVRVAPKMTAGDILKKYGDPAYVTTADYTATEVAMILVYPDKGLIIWVAPGDPNSSITEKSPVVATIYFDPKEWDKNLKQATLQKWTGYGTYKSYKAATPIVTPAVTATPGQ